MSKLVYENDIKDENWLDIPGERKVTESQDPKWASTSIFLIVKEDHTLANMLRMKLHTNRSVKFAGYKVPHPTVHNFELTVQTAATHQSAPVPTPAAALLQATNEVLADIDAFDAGFEAVARMCSATA
jgi:DNA-directed RNA polymerase II subunit RPB11